MGSSSETNVNILKYKSYEGTAEVDTARQVCFGKVLFIDDLVTYEADDVKRLQKEFEAAVDDYLETCKELQKEPQQPLKGQFNVRIPPELHKLAVLRAKSDNATLNDVVVRSLDAFLINQKHVNHNVYVTLQAEGEATKTLQSTASQQRETGTICVH
jgi:predicted HicB family RNase H-like nuclease